MTTPAVACSQLSEPSSEKLSIEQALNLPLPSQRWKLQQHLRVHKLIVSVPTQYQEFTYGNCPSPQEEIKS